MYIVILTALGVGGATVLGGALGLLFKGVSSKFSNVIMSFACGVMLAAAVNGLILPSLDYGGRFALPTTLAGLFCGALLIFLLDKLIPRINSAINSRAQEPSKKFNKSLLFVIAIAIHNFPEGIAAGVGFGTDNVVEAITVALGIALQNVPEGMIVIAPMLASGIPSHRAFLYAALTGAIEVVGTLVGYFAVCLSGAILPFALALAGGTMLYVISDEIIPETHENGSEWRATFSLLLGFAVMLVTDYCI